jgi:hypothetical protein
VYCSEVERAIDDDITVIASAGNSSDAVVHCPSNAPGAISAAGVEFECTFNMPRAPKNPTNNPSLAYWTRLWSAHDDYPENVAEGAFCTTRGCWAEGGGCDQYKRVTEWSCNPLPSGKKPDLLAPVHYAEEAKDKHPFVWAASSFAAPVVAGCLAGILSTTDDDPSPFEIQQALRDGATEYDGFSAGVFDATRTQDLL